MNAIESLRNVPATALPTPMADEGPAEAWQLDHEACYRAVRARDARFDGRFFTAVRSTGIYCRPVCPARTPKPENVAFYPSAAAAQEAGYRPCLRCRPEAAPDLAVWRGTSNTVSRALSLIELGALDDEGDVAALADRLGVGDRHLRRLFRRHLGASPAAVAQTRRVLLAKQLIHETTLSMTEVALAAGFGSTRRFNETFQQLYGTPPGALRRQGGKTVTSTTAGEVRVRLRYRPPYDWPAMLAYLRARAISGVERVDGERYLRSIAIAGAQGVVAVQPGPGDTLLVTIRHPKLSALPAIIARLRRVFDLGADPQAIGERLSEDSILAPLVSARPGLRVPGAWDGFELAIRAVLGQQITVRAAIALAGRLVARYGEPLAEAAAGDSRLNHVFPAPEALAYVDLSTLGMPGARAAALSAVAAAVLADPDLFGPRGDLDQAIARLRALPGIGDWTACYIAMRQLREPDAFPAADVGLMRALALLEGGERPSARGLLARAEVWRPWRAYAAQHLWTSLDRPMTTTDATNDGSRDRRRPRRIAGAKR